MPNLPGGSAYAMVSQIGEGYLLVTERTFRRFRLQELERVLFELEKRLRNLRGEPVPLDDVEAIKKRNRRLQRLTSARSMLQTYLLRVRRGRQLDP